MESNAPQIPTGRKLIDSLVSLGSKAYNPAAPNAESHRQEFSDFVQSVSPVSLLPALNVLIQPGHVPEWLRTELLSVLALLPLRDDEGERGSSGGGVRATLEFVFSVHPSSQGLSASGGSSSAPPSAPPLSSREGASITHEALKMATQLLASPPARSTADEWFRGLAPQLLRLLDGHDGLELAKVAAYVIGFGILGRKSYGAPGTPGWRYFAEPILSCIDPARGGLPARGKREGDHDDIVDLRQDALHVLVSAEDVAQGLRRLQTLIISHPNPGLTRRLLGPIVLPLWALSSWSSSPPIDDKRRELFCQPARNLLKIYLCISFSAAQVLPIVQNLLFTGHSQPRQTLPWEYRTTPSGQGICIAVPHPTDTPSDSPSYTAHVVQSRWHEVRPKSDALLDLLEEISTDDDSISSVFLLLFARRSATRREPRKADAILIKTENTESEPNGYGKESGAHGQQDHSPLVELLESTLLQRVMERFPERLARRPQHIMELVRGLLADLDETLLATDELVPLLLSLLNLVVTSPGFKRSHVDSHVLQAIEQALETVASAVSSSPPSRPHGDADPDDRAQTAKNLLLFLRFRDDVEEPDETAPTTTDEARRAEDRKTHRLAMSYIMQADAPPPVRAEGLNILQGLLRAHSAVLDIPALLVLLSSLLSENEDYINLRVIQMFALVADRHPRATTRELLDHYVDAGETGSVDTRLRFGEALLQVVQRLGETFSGETAQQVGEALLATAGRHGQRRPKTAAKQAAKQAREERMASMKKSRERGEAEEKEDDDDEEVEDKDNAEIRQIVEGWSSHHGSEDVRIRASALSVLATGIETSVAGLGATLASSAVDLCLHVLAMEPEPSQALVRRAAIVLVLSFVRALQAARASGRRLGFGLTAASQEDILRILRYVADTDNDGLVRQHAADVVESLENWKLGSLLPPEAGWTGGLGGVGDRHDVTLPRLAGLSVHPQREASANTSAASAMENKRPRIEEVE